MRTPVFTLEIRDKRVPGEMRRKERPSRREVGADRLPLREHFARDSCDSLALAGGFETMHELRDP